MANNKGRISGRILPTVGRESLVKGYTALAEMRVELLKVRLLEEYIGEELDGLTAALVEMPKAWGNTHV